MSVEQIQRKYPRFDTDVKVSFKMPYDFRTEVDFKLDLKNIPHQDHHAYIGFSKNISVDGLCFESPKELKQNDRLWIELHLPKSSEIIYMEGIVRWSRLITATPGMINQYLTGVLINKVDGAAIDDTIYFDQQYQVTWSQLLERVLGGFAKLHKKRHQT